jgi:hypothetical protein
LAPENIPIESKINFLKTDYTFTNVKKTKEVFFNAVIFLEKNLSL